MPVRDVNAPAPNEVTELKRDADKMKNTSDTAQQFLSTAKAIKEVSALNQPPPSPFNISGEMNLGKIDVQAQIKEANEAKEKAAAQAKESDSLLRTENQGLRDKLQLSELKSLEDKFTNQITELRKSLETGAKQGTILEQIKEAKETALELGMGAEKKTSSGLSSEAQLALEKMRMEHELTLEEMRDARSRRDKEWELIVMKWQEDKSLREKEVAGKSREQAERNEMIGNGIDGLARVIMKAASEGAGGGGGNTGTGAPAREVVEAGVGEFGGIACQHCGTEVPIAKDAARAVCPGCSSVFDIKRVSAPTVPPEPVPEPITFNGLE